MIREYIDMQEYSYDNADRFERISEHLMECEQCSAKYERMLYAGQIVDEFSIREYESYLSLEQALLERYQLDKLLIKVSGKSVEARIREWIKNKWGKMESSIKVYLKDEKYNKLSGMIHNNEKWQTPSLMLNKKDQLSLLNTLEPIPAFAMRGGTDEKKSSLEQIKQSMNLSNLLVAPDNNGTRLILDGNQMQLSLQLENKPSYQENPPMGILIGDKKEMEPLAQVAEYKDGVYQINFMNLQSGEYIFYLDV
jgi:hypothetical protein